MASSSSSVIVGWEVFTPIGPQLAYHIGAVVNGCLYVHGGITVCGSTQPSDKLHKLDLTSQIWEEVRTSGSPALSHHACVCLSDRYLLLIGGWNGKARSGKLFVYDTVKDVWSVPHQSGFPEDAGLSSHTATHLDDGSIVILGREGSLRMQRRSGNAFLLQGTVEKGFHYLDYSRAITSRSGHSTNILGSKMYVIGGRSDNLLELQPGFKSASKHHASSLEKLSKFESELHPMSKLPCGRKHHIAVGAAGVIFIHGGETFDGRSREPVGEMYLVGLRSGIKFYNLGDCSVKRAGHIAFTDGEKVFIHGGFTGKNTVCGDIQLLKIPKS